MNIGYTAPASISDYRLMERTTNPTSSLEHFLNRNPFPFLVRTYTTSQQVRKSTRKVARLSESEPAMTYERLTVSLQELPPDERRAYPVRQLGKHVFKGQIFIGRAQLVDLFIGDDDAVSRAHAFVTPEYSLAKRIQGLLVVGRDGVGDTSELLALYQDAVHALWVVKDNNSSNYTYLNGQQLGEEKENPSVITDGDNLTLGNNSYQLLWPHTFAVQLLGLKPREE